MNDKHETKPKILCPDCKGHGYIYCGVGSRMDEEAYDECSNCKGTGVVEDDREAV